MNEWMKEQMIPFNHNNSYLESYWNYYKGLIAQFLNRNRDGYCLPLTWKNITIDETSIMLLKIMKI